MKEAKHILVLLKVIFYFWPFLRAFWGLFYIFLGILKQIQDIHKRTGNEIMLRWLNAWICVLGLGVTFSFSNMPFKGYVCLVFQLFQANVRR